MSTCNKILKKSALSDHMRNKHTDPSKLYKWDCKDCLIKFKHKKTYKRHLMCEAHRKVVEKTSIPLENIEETVSKIKESSGRKNFLTGNYKCLECNQTFGRIYELNKHKKQVHTLVQQKEFECQHCKKSYYQKYKLTRHIQSSHQQPEHECPTCKNKFKRADTLARHIRNVHNTTYVFCEFCKKKLCDREYYERHLNICVLNKTVNKYPGSSQWERYVSKYLLEKNIEFIFQKKYPDLISKNDVTLSFDFYIPHCQTLIEVNGKQHYELTNYRNAQEIFERTKNHDILKQEYADKNNLQLLVIDTRDYNSMLKLNEFLDTTLSSKLE